VSEVVALATLQVVAWSSSVASGVAFAATCHSALVGSRFPEFAHASSTWNHEMDADGGTAARLAAWTSPAQLRPSSAHGA
jgi:hypothetical protein